jgi:FMN phosphatase YigB (HAD superfamily)
LQMGVGIYSKPDPRLLQQACEALGVESGGFAGGQSGDRSMGRD